MEQLMTLEEIAFSLRVRRSWIYQRTHRGCSNPIPFVKVGRLLRFREAEVTRWLEAQKAAA